MTEDVQSYLGEVTMASLISDEHLELALVDQRERMRHFLKKRPAEDTLDGLHRPKKRHRRSAMQVGCHMHSVFSGWLPAGAFHFQIPAEKDKRLPAILWPRCTLVPDQGADNVALSSHWNRKLGLNVDFPFDVHCHGLHNDITNGIAAGGLGDHLQLSLVRLNCSSSPWGEATRWKQANEQLTETFTFEDDRQDVAWQELLPCMLKDPHGADFVSSADPSYDYREYVKAGNHPFINKGEKVVKNRFVKVIRALREESQHPTLRKYGWLKCCVEMDMLGSRRFAELSRQQQLSHLRGTSRHRDTPVDAALRKACANQMVVSLMSYMADDTVPKDKIIVSSATPWEQQFGKTNAELRSVNNSRPYTVRMLNGEFLLICEQTFGQLSDVGQLEYCEFTLPANADVETLDPVSLAKENELAEDFRGCTEGIVGARFKRMAKFLLSWSSRCAFFTEDSEKTQTEINVMRNDHKNYEDILKPQVARVPGIQAVLHRSPWDTMPELQVFEVLRDAGFKISAPVGDFFRQATNVVLQEQIAEDCFNVIKREVSYQNKVGSLQTDFANLIKSQTASVKHNYKEVVMPQVPVGHALALPKEAYRVRYHTMPRDLLQISGHKQAVDYFNPGATDVTLPYADFPFVDKVISQDEVDHLGNAWLGAACVPLCGFVLRHKSPDGDGPGPWVLPLAHFKDGAFVGWPMQERRVPFSDIFYFRHMTGVKDIRDYFHSLVQPDNWQAMQVVSKSPASIVKEHGRGKSRLLVGGACIQLVQNGPIGDFLEVFADLAFGNMNKTWMSRLCKLKGIAEAPSDTLETLESAVRKFRSGLSDVDVMQRLSKRMVCPWVGEHNAITTFLDVEDSHLLFTHEDHLNFTGLKNKCRAGMDQTNAFQKSWQKRATELKIFPPAVPVPKAKTKAKGKGKGGAGGGGDPPRAPPEGDLQHSDLKPYCPPGGFIWRGNHAGCWASHYPPFRRYSASWHAYGHRESALMCLRSLWKHHHDLRGEELSACPIVGLFT